MDAKQRTISIGRHSKACTVCSHAERAQIEQDFVNWRGPSEIASAYGLADRSTVYRHAHAFGLFGKRRRNVRSALEKIIERSADVEVTAAAVVAAVQAYAKLNSRGEWVDRSENVNLNEMFDRMNERELEAYARDGTLPSWWPHSATPSDSQESLND